MSFVIEVSFASNTPELAAEIANAVVEAYVADQQEMRNGMTQKANLWLQDRIRELGEQSTTADRAVSEFKTKNNLLQTSTGQLVDDQQVSELNTRLIDARAQTGAAQARLDRINQVLRADGAGTVSDTLNNPIVTQLRTKYLELTNREAEWSVRLGSNHAAVVNVRRQIQEIRNSLRGELERTAETYKSDFEISKQRQQAIEKQLTGAEEQAHASGHSHAILRELESNARTYHALYDNLLQRYEELRSTRIVTNHPGAVCHASIASAGQEFPEKSTDSFGCFICRICFGLWDRTTTRPAGQCFPHDDSDWCRASGKLHCLNSTAKNEKIGIQTKRAQIED